MTVVEKFMAISAGGGGVGPKAAVIVAVAPAFVIVIPGTPVNPLRSIFPDVKPVNT